MELTNQQKNILRQLKRRKYALIEGGAGTGKTVLALDQAQTLATQDLKVLFLCYNQKLGNALKIKSQNIDNLHSMSFHEFCSWRIRQVKSNTGRDLVAEASISYPGENLYDVLMPDALIISYEFAPIQYDVILIDEGQDFKPEYWLAIEMLLDQNVDTKLYIFQDCNQAIYTNSNDLPIDCETLFLFDNYRNTKYIHNAAYQFYKGSIQSVNDRLAWLASRRGNPNKSKQGIKFNFGDPLLNQLLNSSPKRFRDYGEAELATVASRLGSSPELYDTILKAQAISLSIAELKAKTGYTDLNPEFGSISNSWSVWSDGEVSVGKNSASTIASSREFNRTVITVGLDKEYEEDNLIGFALSAGREDADVGTVGSNIKSDNLGAILYTTYASEHLPQIEASLGYGDLTFDTKRIDGNETLTGERTGGIYYGSVGVRRSNTPQDRDMTYSTHLRLNLGQITLKSYSETGGITALTYSDQDIDYEELETGIEMSKTMKWRSFTMRPHTMVQYSHFLNKSSPASMRYVGLTRNYSLSVPTEMQSGWSVSAGVDLWGEGNLSSSLALSRSQSNTDNYINSVSFGLRYQF